MTTKDLDNLSDAEVLEILFNPDKHMKQRNAITQLRATKKFHEDKAQLNQVTQIEQIIEVPMPDKYGRIMTKKKIVERKTDDIRFEINEEPRKNRKPKKRPPITAKKGFVDDQKKYLMDQCYNPIRDMK